MIPAKLAEAADEVWRRLGGSPPFPRGLQPRAALGLPLTFVPVEGLSTGAVVAWLGLRGVRHRFLCHDRSLRGCVVAARGQGAIFIDPGDGDDERRFTEAHEVAHFLLDYLFPREQALAVFGEAIRLVLDGDRPPTAAERVDALLASVPLGTYANLMPRDEAGRIRSGAILTAEDRANRLALELLAPLEAVRRYLPDIRGGQVQSRIETEQILTSHFRLPPGPAREYAALLARPLGTPSTSEWLGF